LRTENKIQVSGHKMDLLKTYPGRFTEWLNRLGYAQTTAKSYKQRLESFLLWLKTQHIQTLGEIKQTHFEAFKTHLEKRTNQNKKIRRA